MKQMSYVTRWLYSTSHKDIAILYLAFGMISSVVGTAMSALIRIELASGNSQIFHENNQAYNVIITGHGVVMIFLFIMPVIIGAFGKMLYENICLSVFYYNSYPIIKYIGDRIDINNNTNEDMKYNKYLNDENLGSYLAGLIEGDGSISVHDDVSKNRYSPIISIAFNKNDYQLALFFKNKLNIGKIQIKSNTNVCIWQIKSIEDVYKIINITNGYYRTPKYEAIIRCINWINNYINNYEIKFVKNLYNYNINIRSKILSNISILEIKPLDTTNILNNSWLAGFTDADGYFYIGLNKSKNKEKINLSYRIEIKQSYHKDNPFNVDKSYYPIMQNIASSFNSSLYSRVRNLKLNSKDNNKLYYSYIVSVNNVNNLKLVNSYFSKYNLLSSKYLKFKDWSKLLLSILNKSNRSTNPECISLGKEILENFNNNRSSYNWDHLNI